MMHKHHNAENPGWTEPSLSSEQWENAYRDLSRRYHKLLEENQRLKLERDNAREWKVEPDVGC